MTISTGVCSPWADLDDVCSPCNDYDFDPVVLMDSLEAASYILFEFTGRRWPGECTDTVRPCGYRTSGAWGVPFNSDYQQGNRFLAGWCGCNDSRRCGCGGLSEIRLPSGPVTAITEVKIDGVVILPDRYRLDDNQWLVYIPESDTAERQAWPCCQRLDRPDTEDDTFSVSSTYGTEPPAGGRNAAAALGCELALSCNPETVGQCRLPKRVTTITRQGISIAVLDPLTLFDKGKTGLSEVDVWVAATKVGAASRRATLFLPGRGRRFRRTNT